MSSAQSLILSVQGERAERFDGRSEQVFDCRDGSIGRADECDWVLGAEGVSRLHALVRYLNGLYFIEDRSTNGMLLNGAPLRKGEPAALKQGDRLQIDTFEIGVRLGGDTATQWNHVVEGGGVAARSSSSSAPVPVPTPAPTPAPHGDPLDLSLLLAPRRGSASGDASHADGLIPGAADAAVPGESLDPLAMFDAPSSYFDTTPPAASSGEGWNHTPALADRFRPPQVEAPRASGPVLPDDWDATGSRVAPRVESYIEPSIAPHVESSIESSIAPRPDDSLLAPVPERARGSVAAPVAQPHPAVPDLPVETEAVSSPSSAWQPTQVSSAAPQQHNAPIAAPAAPTTQTPPELTEMFHIAIDAMMDVLRARAELKNSFRLPATLIQRSENNPLKFAPTAQEAVRKLFAPPDSGFLSGSAALNEAAEDIRNHQMAMLAGVRSAFQSVLAHFDPARLEQELEGSARRLPLGGRPRYWERYKEQFDALTRNPDECFRRLFGDEFARAYEDQLARLKSRRP